MTDEEIIKQCKLYGIQLLRETEHYDENQLKDMESDESPETLVKTLEKAISLKGAEVIGQVKDIFVKWKEEGHRARIEVFGVDDNIVNSYYFEYEQVMEKLNSLLPPQSPTDKEVKG